MALLAQVTAVPTAPRDSAIRDAIARVVFDTRIRIHVKDGQRVIGRRLATVGDDSLRVGRGGSTAVYAVADIDSLWVRHGSFAALVGTITAIPCAVLGAMFGSFVASDPDSGGHPGGGLKGGAIGAVAGAATCAIPGAIFGSLNPRWRLIYPER